jgi:hypothetical protein
VDKPRRMIHLQEEGGHNSKNWLKNFKKIINLDIF